MAVEAQLYLVLPLLLLVVRRRGAVVMVSAVLVVVTAIGIVGPHVSHLDTFVTQSAPDLAALFALGVLAAGIVSAGKTRRSWPWAWLALAAVTPVLLLIWWRGSVWTGDHLYWVDLALGPAIACLLAGLATGRPAPLVRLLDARPVRGLGRARTACTSPTRRSSPSSASGSWPAGSRGAFPSSSSRWRWCCR